MSPLVVWYCTYCLYCQGWYWWVELDGKKHPLHSLETFDSCFWRWELLVKIWTVWWWWWWWWWMVFVVWLTDERRLALFPAGTIVRDPHHYESKTRRAGFEPAQNLSSGLVEWSSAVVITTTPRPLVCLWLKYWSSLGQLKLPFSKTLKTRLFILPK